MVQFKILNGQLAGSTIVARHFPFRIGRAAEADLSVVENGVWDNHVEVDFVPKDGFYLAVQQDARASVNGEPTQQSRLKNGDLIELGSLKMSFWLSETGQGSLRWREWLTWTAMAAVCVGQIAVIYFLSK